LYFRFAGKTTADQGHGACGILESTIIGP